MGLGEAQGGVSPARLAPCAAFACEGVQQPAGLAWRDLGMAAWGGTERTAIRVMAWRCHLPSSAQGKEPCGAVPCLSHSAQP